MDFPRHLIRKPHATKPGNMQNCAKMTGVRVGVDDAVCVAFKDLRWPRGGTPDCVSQMDGLKIWWKINAFC